MNSVLFDHQAFTMQAYGGVSRYFIALQERLHNHGYHPALHSPVHRNLLLSNSMRSNSLRTLYVNCGDNKVKYLNFVNENLLNLKNLSKHSIYHPTYYKLGNRQRLKLPLVITVYDFVHELFYGKDIKDKTIQRKKDAIEHADHIICISENTKKDLVNLYGVPECKTTVTHLACSDEWSQTQGNTSYSGRPYILYVGQRGGYKNFDLLVSAISGSKPFLKDFKLIAFGGGGFCQEELKQLDGLGLDETTVQQVNGDDQTLRDLYFNARLFVYPSLYEGFGLPVLEAMTAGCPTLCSNVSSIPEIGGQSVAYFNPDSSEDLRCQIEILIESESLLSTLREKGFEQATNFSWEKPASQTAVAYSHVL